MITFSMTNYRVRNSTYHVTADDLSWCSLLLIGWNAGGDMSGLDPSIIEAGITGRVILTGHDADFHTANTLQNTPGAGFFLAQSMNYVLSGTGVGMVALGDASNGFSNDWLPENWGLNTTSGLTEETTIEFTDDGLATGIFDNLIPSDMNNWEYSYHVVFNSWGNGFRAYEFGGSESYPEVITIGTPFNAYGVQFTKEDDVPEGGCVSPDTEDDNDIVYTICWKNTSGYTLYDVRIVDTLPEGVDYPEGWDSVDNNLNVIPGDPNYSQEDHTYTWLIGTIETVDDGPNIPWTCVTLDVDVNENAIPGMTLYNEAVIIGTYCIDVPDPNDPNDIITTCTEKVWAIATEYTPVCCWDDSNIIYVSEKTTGVDTGLSWENAYNTEYGLKKALDRAWASSCSGPYTIYVAQGTYLPGITENDSFVLPDGTEIYGGFPTGGCDFANRNAKKYKTILSGDLGDYETAYTVVTVGYEALLDGVTVTDGFEYNIYSGGLDFTINNCIVSNSIQYGIYTLDANATIKSCMVKNNGADGIYHESISNNLNVSNSWVMRNNQYGIKCDGSTPTIKNCIISESDLSEEGNEGIRIVNPPSNPVLHNLTISNNKSVGIHFEDNSSIDPNDPTPDYPDIQNCIIYYNNSSGPQLSGIDADFAYYSCIQDCNSVNANYNINSMPQFAYPVDPAGAPDPENYHLAYNSVCIDQGNPLLLYDDQVDYDNEIRVAGTYVDMGADEVYSCDGNYSEDDIANEYDWNADGIVNLEEFELFAGAWLANEPNSPPAIADPNTIIGWNSNCNLDETGSSQYSIDLVDLTVFVNDVPWLWQACWYDSNTENVEEMTMMTTSVTPLESIASVAALSLDTETEAAINPYDRMSNSELAQIVSDIYYLQDCVAEKILQTSKGKDKKDLQDILDFFDEELAKIAESLQ